MWIIVAFIAGVLVGVMATLMFVSTAILNNLPGKPRRSRTDGKETKSKVSGQN
jgi:hypothetical protein